MTAVSRLEPARKPASAPKVFVALALAVLLSACGSRDKPLPGEREPVRANEFVGQDTTPNRARPIALPPAVVNADWSFRNGSASGRPAQQPAFAAEPRLRWSFPLGKGGGRRERVTVTPIAAGGLVFGMDAEANLSAVTPQGARVWTKNLVPVGQKADSAPGGGMAQAGGVLFVTTGFGEVLAMEPGTGQVLWRKSFEAPVPAAPVVEGSRLFVVLRDDTALALSTATGETLWEIKSAGKGAGLMGGATPAVAGGLAVIPFTSGELRGVSVATGLWEWGTAVTPGRPDLARSSIGDITGDPVILGSAIYASSQNGRTLRMERSTGARLWTMDEGAYGPVWPVGDSIFLVSDRGALVRADAAKGEEIWSVELPQFHPNHNIFGDRMPFRAITHFGPILAGDRLWIASGDARLRGFSPTDGRLLTEIELPAGAAAPPVIAGGIMYVVTEDGKLNALQ
ncbi:PQQ-binding-like beta-propeller repeat protein [Rhodobacteraceae bacterium DSL-40]|uniref:outer membrane protein assembly factor BamB family protein n=1 Tax=Amaricoccus sp. B4 TaxID=3368557 RepID=UPI000DAC722F